MEQLVFKNYYYILFSLIVSLAVSCGSKSDADKDAEASKLRYNSLVTKYNKEVKAHNSTNQAYVQSDLLHIDTNQLIDILNTKVSLVRVNVKLIIINLATYTSRQDLRQDLKKLDRYIQDALVSVSNLEEQISVKNMEYIAKNINTKIDDEHNQKFKYYTQSAQEASRTLGGIRDLITAQFDDLIALTNKRMLELPDDFKTSAYDPANETKNLDTNFNPIVDNLNDGGQLIGYTYNAITGDAISDVSISFRIKSVSSSPQFHLVKSDINGEYRSPLLLPGHYLIDILEDKMIEIKNQEIHIKRGQIIEENISLSVPIKDNQYRITLSWCSEKEGAARDIDGNLVIPDIPEPNNFSKLGAHYYGTYLDKDDTAWIGPETITINQVKKGTYKYYVKNYGQKNDQLANSNVIVKIYQGNLLLHSLKINEGEGQKYEFFQIIDGEIKITGNYFD